MRIGAKRDRRGVRGSGSGLLLGAALLALSACGGSGSGSDEGHATPAHVSSLGGTVYGGRQPIVNSAVAIYSAGLNPGDTAVQIAAATTNASGNFNAATFNPAPSNGQLIYVVVQGGDAGGGNNEAIRLMTLAGIWGDANFPSTVNIDELSTVAAASVLQHQMTFPACAGITNNSLSGNCVAIPGAAGLAQRAVTIANLVDVTSGKVSAFLTGAAGGTALNLTLRKLNSLADILAACVNSAGGVPGDGSSCGQLFDQAKPATDTLLAAFQIASSPVINARGSAIAGLLNLPFVYTPVTGGAPADWSVAGKRYAYTGNNIDNNVSGYSIDDAGGVLSAVPGAPFSAGVGAGAAVQDPTGRFLFVANGPTTTTSGNSVSVYTIDPATGTLAAVAGSPFAAGNAPTALALAAGGKYLYVANSGTGQGISAYSVNPASGVLTPITAGARNCNDSGTPDPANCYAAGVAPTGLTVDPSGRYVYVANFYGNDVWAYTIDSGTGALVANGTALAGNNPDALAASPDGQHLYVSNEGGNDLSLYQIQADGSLAALAAGTCGVAPDAGNCFPGGGNPGSVKLSPDGRYAYASNAGGGSVSAWSVNSGNGALTPITGGAAVACGTTSDPANCVPAGNTPAAVGVSAAGAYVYVANRSDHDVSAYAVDSASGALTPLSLSSLAATGTRPMQIAVDPSGKFAYTSNFSANTVSAFSIDAVTGALTALGGDVATGHVAYSVTVHPGGRFVYVANQNSLTISAYALDPGSGALTPLTNGVDCDSEAGSGNCFIAGDGPSRVAFTPDGRFAYVANYNGGDLSVYSVTLSGASAGMLTPVPGAACQNIGPANDPHNCVVSGPGSGVFGLGVEPGGLYLYAANQAHVGGGALSYSIDQITGALTQTGIAALPYGPLALAIDPNGHVYVGSFQVGSVAAYGIGGSGILQALTGGVDCNTFSGSGNCYLAGSQVFGVAVDPLGRFLYTANDNGNDVSGFTIGSGGQLTSMPATTCNNQGGLSSNCYAAGNGPYGIVVDPAGRHTYVANQNDNTVQAYVIDAVSGALSPLSSASPYAAGQGPASLAFGP